MTIRGATQHVFFVSVKSSSESPLATSLDRQLEDVKMKTILTQACLLTGSAVALSGIDGVDPYYPTCATACSRATSNFMLLCSEPMEEGGGHYGHGMTVMTTPACRADDSSFLSTLAWCMKNECAAYNIPVSDLQAYWEASATGDPMVPGKWSYPIALDRVPDGPIRELGEHESLNFTAVVPHYGWMLQYVTLSTVMYEATIFEGYGIAMLVIGFGVPILLTVLDYLPFMTSVLQKVKPYLVYPSIIGTYQVRPLPYLLGNAPTIGQSTYIALMVIVNIIFTAVSYKASDLFLWYPTHYDQILAFVMWRTGTYGFALLPLTLLFSSRNNVLLWLSNWSHSTYMLLHRWIARIFAIQVLVHSITALALYVRLDSLSYEQKLPYWIWGIVGTIAVVIMLPLSILYIRRKSYELFLAMHIILAIIVIVGCWYHVALHYQAEGHKQWMYAAFAVWAFDRLLRVARVLKSGIRRAKVTDVGEGFVRVDVPGIRWSANPGQHVYVHFPTLNLLKPWESHPFSVLPTAMLRSSTSLIRSSASDSAEVSEQGDIEKHETVTALKRISVEDKTTAGLTLFIRKSTGMTKSLKAHGSLITLLDGPYPNNPTDSILQCDRLLLIGGGIGITGMLPWLTRHSNAKLCWSVKESAAALVEAMDNVLSGLADKDVRVGQRLDINALINQEMEAGWKKIGVVACGPGGLCDEVRAAVVVASKKGKAVFELEVDAYSW